MLSFDVIAPVPEIFAGFKDSSIMGRAVEEKLIAINVHNLRDYTHDKHRQIDDRPFGGGAGMVLKPEPIFEAIETLRRPDSRLLLMSPQGRTFTQRMADEYAAWGRARAEGQILILCGRYEGLDERVIEHFRPEMISLGDYVIAGGEVAAMVVIEAVARLIEGVVGNAESLKEESFTDGRLEYPQYTRPAEFRGYAVPEVLMSGHHKRIEEWRAEESRKRTAKRKAE